MRQLIRTITGSGLLLIGVILSCATSGAQAGELLLPVAKTSRGHNDQPARVIFGFLSSNGEFHWLRAAGEEPAPQQVPPAFWIEADKRQRIEAILPSITEHFQFGPETIQLRKVAWIRVRAIRHDKTKSGAEL